MTTSSEIIRVENVSYRYDGDSPDATLALSDVSCSISGGEFIGLVGQNGSGKSTFARHLNGLLKPGRGRVLVDGQDTRGVEPGRLTGHVGYVFQNPDHALFLTSVRDEIAYSLSFQNLSRPEAAERVERALAAFGLAHLADRHPASLGRGTRRLVILAATYAMEPNLLVLDEPTGGLDHRLTRNLIRTLRDYVDSGRSVLLISHNMQLIANTCGRVLVLAGGRLLSDSPPGELFRNRELLVRTGLRPPDISRLAWKLRDLGIAEDIVSIESFVDCYSDLCRCSRGERS